MGNRSIKEIENEMAANGTSPLTISQDIKKLQESINREVSQMDEGKLTLRQARLNKGMSVEKVAEETGYSVKRVLWHENNTGDLNSSEAIEFCKLYDVSLDDVSFRNDSDDRRELHSLYPSARRMVFVSSLKNKVSDIILSITDDELYSDKALMVDLFELIEDIHFEDEILIRELSEVAEKENHLNLSLAGR